MKSYLCFNKNIFIFSSILFSFLVVFGTLSHEYGHILVAKFLGFETILHYGSMSWFKNGIDGNIIASENQILLVTLGGVLQTISIGTIGAVFLYFSKTKTILWLGISMTLFWSREIINLTMSTINGFLYTGTYFGGDELIISKILKLPDGFFSISLALLAVFFCFYAFYKIPLEKRLSVILGGLVGGVFSYIIWFGYLGKQILP